MREVKNLIKYAKSLGYAVERTSNNHYKLSGHNNTLFMGSTPSDGRRVRKMKNILLKLSEGMIVGCLK